MRLMDRAVTLSVEAICAKAGKAARVYFDYRHFVQTRNTYFQHRPGLGFA
jgi:hypothetical protein